MFCRISWSINLSHLAPIWKRVESFWGPANFLAMPTRNTCSMVTLPPSVIPGDLTVWKETHTNRLHKTPTTKSDTPNIEGVSHFPRIFFVKKNEKDDLLNIFFFKLFLWAFFFANKQRQLRTGEVRFQGSHTREAFQGGGLFCPKSSRPPNCFTSNL